MSDSPITVSTQRPAAPRRGRPRARLTIVHPRELARSIELGEVPLVLGRQPGAANALRVEHQTVSREHLDLRWDTSNSNFVVRDLASRNGSYLDGNLLAQPTALRDNAVLRLGDVVAVFELLSAHEGALVAQAEMAVDSEALFGQAASLASLRSRLLEAARDGAPVLIVGESGVGKERLAGELHRLSRRTGKLVAVNCAALSPQLVESQLFGHRRGAFTGATETGSGFFRTADDGTLFLDEVGELPIELQPKLLRAIEEGEIQPVGATEPLRVDVRVVAATHRDLGAAAAEGRFRPDLYARLSLWELHVPPMRQRRVDFLDWLDRFARAFRGRTGRLEFDAPAVERLLTAPWPLNLRSLDRLVRELPTDRLLTVEDLPAWLASDPILQPAARAPEVVASPEPAGARPPVPTRDEFAAAFAELDGNVRALSRRFDRDRKQIYRWIEQWGLVRGRSG